MDNSPIISIIIPIYNAEKYIFSCLDNICLQTFFDIEIICVNDGSTDNSLKILEKYMEKDKRIKIINQKNLGVSAARNSGIKNSLGEYILFVDSDDLLDNNACQILCEYVKKYDADIIQFQHVNKVGKFKFLNYKNINTLTSFNLFDNVDRCFPKDDYIFCWDRLYKKSFLIEQDVRFSIGQSFAEDFLFIVQLYSKNPKVLIVEDFLYEHIINSNSVCQTSTKYEIFKSIKNINRFLEETILPINSELYLYALNTIFYNILRLWQDLYYSEYRTEYNLKINEFLSQLKNHTQITSYKMVTKYLFLEKNYLSNFYWKMIFPIEKYFYKFFIKQCFIRISILFEKIKRNLKNEN